MARLSERLVENVPGEFFVDATCIDCGICRWVAPASFSRAAGNGLSYVRRQPDDGEARRRALMALVACPTGSIGTAPRADASEGVAAFPEPLGDDLYFCGFASPDSYGAASWFIRRPEGNVLVDSPRAAAPLLRRLEAMGGVRTLFLTHRDDVADHEKFRARFSCERILHAWDVGAGTASIERRIEGDDPVALADDLTVIPVPGHTRGSAALLYRDAVLFSGDHLWYDLEDRRLDASRGVCWYSWPHQIRSMERLLDFRFEWVLPGHGDPWRAPSAAAMRAELERLVARMKSEA
jgi:glyoxylase-like metal-dependent hydrolase (beta-lactamase superfamily II)